MPLGQPQRLVAAVATLRRTSLTPDDVIVLAAVEATANEIGRQVPGTATEIAANARMHVTLVVVTLEGLRRHRLVGDHDDEFGRMWTLTGLGREVLAELIRKERKGRPRQR